MHHLEKDNRRHFDMKIRIGEDGKYTATRFRPCSVSSRLAGPRQDAANPETGGGLPE